MDVGKIQYFIAKLTIDYKLFEEFKDNSESLLRKWEFAKEETEYLKNLNIEDLNVFREVVNGTREYRFKELFPLLANSMDNEWSSLIHDFHKNTIINSSKNDNDLKTFINYLKTFYPKSFIANIGLYEYILYSYNRVNSQKNPSSNEKNKFVISHNAKLMNLDYNLDDLLEKTKNKDRDLLERESYYVLLKNQDDEIDIFEIENYVFNILKECSIPTTKELIAINLKKDLEDIEEVLQELFDNNLLKECG
ncbi:hypothetical protein [Bacillus chungangensis]|uniref:Uncharacterized protein n=1 Tax=Bacillus chungangensis TaxID=587633 RepID=A0ABT9WSP3_9BACI|nr:hypothetical protein [Bacillus chungangensis]MDQ0176247.1 hypothetical protein [Bacillus chungangensis]